MQNTNNQINNKSQNVRDFIRYNNTVPLFVAILIVISGSAFAATPTGQETITNTLIGKQEKVISVDNTYLATIDLNSWSPRARVNTVSEDTNNYYIDYTFSTIDIVNFKWQNLDKNLTLTVGKEILKDYKSLNDYVEFQLKENIVAENDRLARTQKIEKQNITQKQITTTYTGLAGLVLDENTRVEEPEEAIVESATPGIFVPTPTPTPTPIAEEIIENTSPLPETIQIPEATTTATTIATTTATTSTETTPIIETPPALESTPSTEIIEAPVETPPAAEPAVTTTTTTE